MTLDTSLPVAAFALNKVETDVNSWTFLGRFLTHSVDLVVVSAYQRSGGHCAGVTSSYKHANVTDV